MASPETTCISRTVATPGGEFEFKRAVRVNEHGIYDETIPYPGTFEVDSDAVRVSETDVREGNTVTNFDAEGTGYWSFDEGDGDVAYDRAGDHHLRGVTGRWTSGVRGTGLTVGGDDPRLTVPAEDFDVGDDDSLSVAFALKRDLSEVEPPLPRIAGTSDYRFQAFRDGLGFVVFDDSGVAAGSHALPTELAEWTHVAAVLDRDDGELRVYQDGSLVNTADAGGLGAITSDSPFSVGPERGRLNGRIRIDDPRVFHRALSPDEVRDSV